MRVSSSGAPTLSELPHLGELPDPGRRVAQEPSENGLVVGSRLSRPAGHPARGARERRHDPLRDDLAHLRMGEPQQIAAAPAMRLADEGGRRPRRASAPETSAQDGADTATKRPSAASTVTWAG